MKKTSIILISVLLVGLRMADGQQKKGVSDPFGFAENPTASTSDPLFRIHQDPHGEDYFPKGRASYYTYFLRAMQEPSIMGKEAKGTDFYFRFTWLRSFRDLVAIRVWRTQGKVQCHYIALGGESLDGPRMPKDEQTLQLTSEQANAIENMVSSEVFWTSLNEQEKEMIGLDGARWVFEWKDVLGYRLLDVWTPSAQSPEAYRKIFGEKAHHRDFRVYTEMGVFLLKLCKRLPENPSEIY